VWAVGGGRVARRGQGRDLGKVQKGGEWLYEGSGEEQEEKL
jgi:hypothetical protein